MKPVDRIVVDRAPWATRVAFLAAGEIVEIWVEGTERPSPLGGIALARVTALRPELGSAVVAIPGGEAFVNDRTLVEGGAVPVQVIRDAAGGKRPVARTAIELSAGPVVLTPSSPGIGLSASIGGKARRASLKLALSAVVPADLGLVIRSAGAEVPIEALTADAGALVARWRALFGRARTADAPMWLEQPPALIEAARSSASGVEPEVDDTGRLFEACSAAEALEMALGRRVPLPGGAELVVDSAEAATLIDVNLPAGGGRDQFRRANEAAGAAAVRQMRLRSLRGTVFVDLPRMTEGGSRASVLEAVGRVAEMDPTQTRVLGWTPGGMLELIREGARRPLAEEFLEPAEQRTAPRAAAWSALAGLRREAVRIGRPRLRVAPAVAEWLEGPGRLMFEGERRRLGHLSLVADPALGREAFRVESED